jgi:L-threonylcarbamoyladenylate synthase
MIDAALLSPAVAHLGKDGFIAYPTETVWGLGACADRPRAVARLMAWKGRAEEAPMSVLVPSVDVAEQWGCRLEGPARELADAFWPGPVTLVVPCAHSFAPGIEGKRGTLGLRCSSHPVAHALSLAVARAGLGPLTSTSMNRTGEPPARDLAAARVLSAGPCDLGKPWLVSDPAHDAGGGRPSSVVDCTATPPEILRAGAIDAARLEETWSRRTRSPMPKGPHRPTGEKTP